MGVFIGATWRVHVVAAMWALITITVAKFSHIAWPLSLRLHTSVVTQPISLYRSRNRLRFQKN